MGGIGKTTLSIKLAQKIQGNFEYVIWRSLQNSPPIEEILTELIQFFDHQEEINFPNTVKGKISRLLHYLRDKRCLLLLDNFESVLQGGTNSGKYSEGYEDYGYLLQQIGQVNHQSCLIITSREKPKEVGLLEGPKLEGIGTSSQAIYQHSTQSSHPLQKASFCGNTKGTTPSPHSHPLYPGGCILLATQSRNY